jgi:DNA-binding transcriptional ArsR family regulator
MDERCEIRCHDEVRVKRIQSELEGEDFPGTADLFKALADPTRLKIAYALSREDELCVCDVAHIIGSSVATASHHLRLLRNMGLAKFRRNGKLVFYSLDDEHVRQLVQIAFAHRKEGRPHGKG